MTTNTTPKGPSAGQLKQRAHAIEYARLLRREGKSEADAAAGAHYTYGLNRCMKIARLTVEELRALAFPKP